MIKKILAIFDKNSFVINRDQLNFWLNQLILFKNERDCFRSMNNAQYYLNKGRVEILEDLVETIKESNRK
jgi:hypothetical protein